MTTHELALHIDDVRASGADVSPLVLERQARTSCIAIYVLTLIGVGIAARKQRED